MLRFALASILVLAPFAAAAQEGSALVGHPESNALVGRLDGTTYVSPTGMFTITVPVLEGLGGAIKDTPNVVTFQDNFSTLITIVAFVQDPTERWELSTQGTKNYLKYYFNKYAYPDFQRSFKNAQIESALFLPGMLDGSLIVYVLLPGGSMFPGPNLEVAPDKKPPVAKRANLLFVKNGCAFVISTELAERVIEGHAYAMTTEEENVLLRERLIDIVHRMQFLSPPAQDK